MPPALRPGLLRGLALAGLVAGAVAVDCPAPDGCTIVVTGLQCNFKNGGQQGVIAQCVVPPQSNDAVAGFAIGPDGLPVFISDATTGTVTTVTATSATATTATATTATATTTKFTTTVSTVTTKTGITNTDTTATGTTVTGTTGTGTTVTSATTVTTVTAAPFNPCDTITVPAGCKCTPEGNGFRTGAGGTVELLFNMVAIEGQTCSVDPVGSGPVTQPDADASATTTPIADTSTCIDSCCCQANVTQCSISGKVPNCIETPIATDASCVAEVNLCVGNQIVIVVTPGKPEEDCDDDTTVIIIVIIFALLLLFVICVALYFCLSKTEPEVTELSSDAAANCDPGQAKEY